MSEIFKSGFMRSVITRVLAILITVSIMIIGVAFISFTTEIRRSILEDKQKQLTIVEKAVSERMDEITSIAYNIGTDSAFYLGEVTDNSVSTQEMTKMLERYLVGNGFIENLAFTRTTDPDTIYTSKGSRSLSGFLITDMDIDKILAQQIVQNIHDENITRIEVAGKGDNAYFTYAYPLPQLAEKPQAHVLIMMPVTDVKSLFETLFLNGNGETTVFDANGNLIHQVGNLDDEIDYTEFLKSKTAEENYKSPSGQKYVLQKTVAKSNSWTYVSAVRYNDTLSGLANKQLALIVIILLMLVTAIVIMLATIITQYRPISNLAAQIAEKEQNGTENGYVDERKVLPHAIATLRDDSEQKQKYETAFYEAEAASKAKSAFLSSMSHDIRTPMNAIIGMTAIARKHIGDQAYVDECLKKVEISSEYLLDIINNVLDMSRIESGRIPMVEEPVMIPALIDSLVSLMTSSVDAKSQKLTVKIEELKHRVVMSDNIHIIQVFVNILSNAVKFTPEGGNITIEVYETESEDKLAGDYHFIFTDTGIGIPPEFIEQVFDTFSRADGPMSSRTEGTGLGMAIAKKLVELMNGTISCESELNKGTTFTVVMHMKYADEHAILSTVKDAGKKHNLHSMNSDITVNLTGRRILLAEDNIMNREIANRIIMETGAEIVDTCNGKEAVEVFGKEPEGYFDLIFMDIQMPVMNGYDAAIAIRSMERADATTIPIYAMTANSFDEDVRQAKAAGMNGHIGKPYNLQMLNQVLEDVLGSSLKSSE